VSLAELHYALNKIHIINVGFSFEKNTSFQKENQVCGSKPNI